MTESIVLIGFMGAGKSTVARLLAKQMGLASVDLDTEIEKQQKMPIPEIFRRFDEAGFRRRETEALHSLQAAPPIVLATGGGIVTIPQNWPLMQSLGKIVWLRVSFQAVCKRIKDGDGRPLAKDQLKMEQLFAERQALYEKADIVIDCNELSPEDVVTEITKRISS